MDVIQLKNPRALMLPDVQKLLEDALGSVSFIAPGGLNSVAEDIFTFVTNDNFFMILGAEDGHFKSLVLGFFPSNNLFPYPTILLFYNIGSKALARATKQKTLDILLDAGYTSVWAVNTSGADDAVWKRAMEIPGKTKAKPLGTVFSIEVS